ncbi:hypothetical protein [Pectobacterium polaris]|uniref:hypothetical protein n=1 Tax=Pectobacterium polaris TaxID=2042057 RepID=UPI002B24625B|nr:hypothetical protein [Pectobacterium polaris]
MLTSVGFNVIGMMELQYDDFSLTWSFGGNSSIISFFGNHRGVISSEHWMTDLSDTFSFDCNGNISNMILSVPNRNDVIEVKEEGVNFGKLVLSCERLPTIQPMTVRMFDPVKRKLICFNRQGVKDVSVFRLQRDFGVMISGGDYCGYIIDNPLDYFSNEVNGYVDESNKPDDFEYHLMDCFFNVMSDNKVDESNNDIESVIVELADKIMPSLKFIKSDFRRGGLESTMQELLSFYC